MKGPNSKNDYQVQVSMLEIYNEVVKDLLNVKSFTKQGLRVRQDKNKEHSKFTTSGNITTTSGWLPVIDRELVFWIRKGFYCEGLTKKDVNSYPEIERFIDEGTKNRTVAATNMNATSSRAHTIGFDLLCSTCIGLQFIYFCAQLWVSMH